MPAVTKARFDFLWTAMLVGFALLFAAGLAVAYLAIRAADAEQRVAHTLEVQKVAHQLQGQLQDVETGQRSFLLLRNPADLDPFNAGLVAVPTTIKNLQQLIADNPSQIDRLSQIDSLIQRRVQIAKHSVDLALAGNIDEAVGVVRSGEGTSLMRTVRRLLGEFVDAEYKLLASREATAIAVRWTLFFSIAAVLVAVCALAALVAQSARQHVMALRREAVRREAVESSLRQSQKMEAVGQLTGGIAHDFNNLLTIILGNLDAAGRRLARVEPAHKAFAETIEPYLSNASQGGKRAAQLTHRLLAFSRQQPLDPKVTDINRLITGLDDLLRRSVGETIEIENVSGAGLWRSLVDAHQLENALLNLVLNSRDAMPNGGRITIETGNAYIDEHYAARFGDVQPGQYALISVADTGIGIPAEMIDRVFDPFFTTKMDGKGSGLGLAMVHGFVKQTGGHVRIYSEPGEGTTVKIYLPRATAEEPDQVLTVHPETELPTATGERILVVEDDEGVRTYAEAVLRGLGYDVVSAGDAKQALELLDGIDMLFTDVVLPGGMNGRVLSEHVHKLRPGLPVLFTTGYTRNAIVHHGRLDAGVNLLTKPYTEQELARKIRDVLDRVRGDNVVAFQK